VSLTQSPPSASPAPRPPTHRVQKWKGTGTRGKTRASSCKHDGYFENGELTSLVKLRDCKTKVLGAVFQYDPISKKKKNRWTHLETIKKEAR
jgi:hypothetical protein